MQNLEPKNGDFVRYIERLHKQKSLDLTLSLQERNASIFKGTRSVGSQPVSLPTQTTQDTSVLERLWNQWKQKKGVSKEKTIGTTPVERKRTKSKTQHVENGFPVVSMILIAISIIQIREMLDGYEEWTGLPFFMLFVAVSLLFAWFRSITKGARKR